MPPAPRPVAPGTVFWLILPHGAANGFVTVTLPFLLTRAGLTVGEAGAIVALALLPQTWRFVWAPVVDLTLTPRRWYGLSLAAAVLAVAAFGVLPVGRGPTGLIAAAAVLAQAAGVFISAPVSAITVRQVAPEARGRAAGWLQAGSLAGTGAGGGLGVWLAAHVSAPAAPVGLAAAMLACGVALRWVPVDGAIARADRVADRLRTMWRDLRAVLREPEGLLVAGTSCLPLAAGGLMGVWSSVAPAWRASPDQVALVTGVLYAALTTLGCVLAGWLMDRASRWTVFLGGSVVMAGVTALLLAAPRTPGVYVAGVAAYALVVGVGYAGYTATVIRVTGPGAAATTYAVLTALGNLPVAYATWADARAYDRWGVPGLLGADTALSLLALVPAVAGLALVRRARRRRAAAPAAAPALALGPA